MIYTDLHQLADKILKGYLNRELHRGDYSYFIMHFKYQKGSPEVDLLVRALDKLAEDEYLKTDGASNNYFNIAGKGHEFIEIGGYEKYIERLNSKEGRQDLIEESILITNDSTISTNNSVKITNEIQKKNIKWNNKLFWITLAVAVAGAMASWMQVFNDSEKRELRHKLKDKDNSLLQIEHNKIQKDCVLVSQQRTIDSLNVILSNRITTTTSTKDTLNKNLGAQRK